MIDYTAAACVLGPFALGGFLAWRLSRRAYCDGYSVGYRWAIADQARAARPLGDAVERRADGSLRVYTSAPA